MRVLHCSGSGSWSGVIAGIEWVRLHAERPAVANISITGPYLESVNAAVNSLSHAGVFTVVAAGNEDDDACNYSPASAFDALTVAASDSSDERAWFSNYGSCVDVYAPGVGITSDWLSYSSNSLDGTSMAAPHAAGTGAIYKSTYSQSASSTIENWIINNATANVISNNPNGTPNRLLFIPGPPAPTPQPTSTPRPTATPQPTATPRPTSTPTPIPEPTIIPPQEPDPCIDRTVDSNRAFGPMPTAGPPCDWSQW